MFFVFAQTLQALEIIRLTMKKVIQYPVLLVLTLSSIVILSSYLAAFFLIEHFYFGMSVIDFSTIANFLGCPYTTHILHTFFCLLALTLATFILVVFSYNATYVLIARELNKEIDGKSFYTNLKYSFSELVRQAAIITLGYFKWWCNIFSNIPDYIQIWQDLCDRSYQPQQDKYQYSLSPLLYPHLIHHPRSQLKEARASSLEIVKQCFSQNVKCRYNFTYLNYLVSTIIFVIFYTLYNYKILGPEQAFIAGFILLVIYFSIIRLIVLVLAVSTYHYCKGQVIKFYSKQFISSAFEKFAEQ